MCTPIRSLATLITGIRPGTTALGMLVDPLNLSGKFSEPTKPVLEPLPDPAVERARAEAEAAQRVNAKLAADQRRRREQGSLLAKGAPAPTFSLGDTEGDPQSPIESPGSLGLRKPTSRSTTAQQASLITRGAPSYGGGGRLSGGQVALQ